MPGAAGGARPSPRSSGPTAGIVGACHEFSLSRVFKAAAETLLRLAADPRHLGARIGLTAVLHTWGYENVYYFAEGSPGWKAAGHPIEKAE